MFEAICRICMWVVIAGELWLKTVALSLAIWYWKWMASALKIWRMMKLSRLWGLQHSGLGMSAASGLLVQLASGLRHLLHLIHYCKVFIFLVYPPPNFQSVFFSKPDQVWPALVVSESFFYCFRNKSFAFFNRSGSIVRKPVWRGRWVASANQMCCLQLMVFNLRGSLLICTN